MSNWTCYTSFTLFWRYSFAKFRISRKSALNVVLDCIPCVYNSCDTPGCVPLRQLLNVALTLPRSRLSNVKDFGMDTTAATESSTVTHVLLHRYAQSFIIKDQYFVWQLLSLFSRNFPHDPRLRWARRWSNIPSVKAHEYWFVIVLLILGFYLPYVRKMLETTVIPRLTKIIRSGITFVSRNVISRRFL